MNGVRYDRNDNLIPTSFRDLESRTQQWLITQARNPERISTQDIEEFRETFISQFPELGTAVPNSRVMRRLMLSATRQRRARRKSQERLFGKLAVIVGA
jgi:hypothetical protein